MIDYIADHMPAFWMTLGLILLAVEILVMGFTTMVLIFAGLGAIATGALMLIGVLPHTWAAGLAGFGIASGVVGVLLWKPFRRLQVSSASDRHSGGDFIGLEFVIVQAISSSLHGSYRYSGINWRVEIDASSDARELAAGTRVRVVAVDVGVFRVAPIQGPPLD